MKPPIRTRSKLASPETTSPVRGGRSGLVADDGYDYPPEKAATTPTADDSHAGTLRQIATRP
jgi:hypothetical protein